MSCRRIQRRRNASPLARALARSIHCHALAPYERCRASVHGNPALWVSGERSRVISAWADLAPVLHSVITRVEEVLTGDERVASSGGPRTIAAIVFSSLEDGLRKLIPSSSARRTMQSVWADVLSVFAVHLDLWLERGLIFDDFGDFFITTSPPGPDSNTTTGERQAYVEPGRLPSFISAENAELILRTGCIVRGTKGLTRPRLADVGRSDGRPSDLQVVPFVSKSMLENGLMMSLRVDAACATCKEWISRELSRVVPAFEVATVFRALRGYLLLGHEGVWRSFFAQFRTIRHLVRPQMTAAESGAVDGHLEKMVSSSIGDHDWGGGELLQFRLHVGKDGGVTASYTIPCPVNYMLRSSGRGGYGEIFATTFLVRHTAHELERCYLSIASVYRSKPFRGDRARQAELKRFSLLRMRMSRFVQAYDDYLQMDVFESEFQSLMRRAVAKLDSDGSHIAAPLPFDDMLGAHLKALDSWLVHSLASSAPIKRRLEAICEACLQFCHAVRDFLDGDSRCESRVQAIEADFLKNAHLFLRVLSSVHSRIGGAQISMLLMRLDFNSLYTEQPAGGSVL
jgi:hypothetical protein